MNKTAINWTDATWNYPIGGCHKLTTECAHCYAFSLAEQRRGTSAFPNGFDLTPRLRGANEPSALLRREGPSLIFCNSMTDIGLSDQELTTEEKARLQTAGIRDMDHARDLFFRVVEATPEHRYQVLTKRPQELLFWLRKRGRRIPPSVWMGVTCGHHSTLKRVDQLRELRGLGARVLFVSAEPLLCDPRPHGFDFSEIDWLIVGGESGVHFRDARHAIRFLVIPNAKGRPFPSPSRVYWVRHLRDRAAIAGCAFWFKQWGGARPDSAGRLLDGVEHNGLPVHVPGAMPERREPMKAPTAALARKLHVIDPGVAE